MATPVLLRSDVLAHLPHAFTTRRGGRSAAPFDSLNFGNPSDLPPERRDTADTIRANFRAVQNAIGASDREIVQVHQIHGGDVHEVRSGHPSHPTSHDTRADAMLTDDPARLLAVRVADCAPILIASGDGRFVAAVHAGWRGVVLRIAARAVEALHARGARDLCAAVGPCIGPEHFEIGQEVADEFRRTFGPNTDLIRPASAAGKFLADIPRAIALQLAAAGVERTDLSTAHDTIAARDDAGPLFFSHRRDKGVTGRMVGIIGPASR